MQSIEVHLLSPGTPRSIRQYLAGNHQEAVSRNPVSASINNSFIYLKELSRWGRFTSGNGVLHLLWQICVDVCYTALNRHRLNHTICPITSTPKQPHNRTIHRNYKIE